MTMEEYYGAALPSLQEAIGRLLEIIGQYPAGGRRNLPAKYCMCVPGLNHRKA